MDKEHFQTALVCNRCGAATRHNLLCEAESDYEYSDVDGLRNSEPAIYRVFRCCGCMQIAVYIWSHLHSPHTDFGECCFPREGVEGGLPQEVKAVYLAAKRVKYLSNAAHALMARRVLETVAKDRGITRRNLADALVQLVEREKIPPTLAEALTLIRLFGNASAHDNGVEINSLHTEMADKFLDVLLDHIYYLPGEIGMFKLLVGIDSGDECAEES